MATICLALGSAALLGGCPPPGDGTADTGTLSGTVSNSLTDTGVADVSVSLSPDLTGAVTTAADGTYSFADLPPGLYELTFENDNYETSTTLAVVFAGSTSTADADLTPTQNVVLNVTVDGDAEPGATLTASIDVETFDGQTTVQGIAWTQSNSVDVTLTGANTDTASVTLPALAAYKDELLTVLREPPIAEDQLPPNVPVPEGEFTGGFADRFQVIGLNPFALEEAGLVTLTVTVTTTTGTYTEDVEIHTVLPWKVSTGVHNVAVGIPVLLYGKDQDAYDWALTPPGGSSAALTDGTSQLTYFTPDVSGLYTVEVTDQTVTPNETVTFQIYAGTWQGAITGQDGEGKPLADNCTICHRPGGFADGDQFDNWRETGHAMIFTEELDTGDHYGESCFACHTVGFDLDVANNGFDDQTDYDAFLAAGLLNNPGDNWTTMLAQFPNAARYGNIQCENCHGPQNGGAHTNGDFRISLAADVCGSCHGEPARHGRYQQWQLSRHANYELAVDEGTNGSCARCHSVNGFLEWLPILLDDDPGTDPLDNVDVTWTEDDVHPATCVTCHDPHSIGTVSGDLTDATVRISGNTPPLIAGFTVFGAGKGAICMTCHNSRRGLRNDDNFAETVADGDAARAPHGSAQTDVLMGQNAYLVGVGVRGSHSLVTDTCVNCHLRQTPPPDLLSYNLGGTNHTFFASDDICSSCHGDAFDASGVQDAFAASSAELKTAVEAAILDLIAAQIDAGRTIDLDGEAEITDVDDIADIELGESHGSQAITVTFTDATVVGPIALGDVAVLLAGVPLGELYDFADARLIKSGWNWTLANNDGSQGIHNPSFVFGMLDASIDALNELAAE